MPFTDTAVLYNDFLQPDGAGLPSFEVGSASWSYAGAWATQGNRAYATSQSGGAPAGAAAWADSGLSDCHVSVVLSNVAGGNTAGLNFRATDSNNLITCRAFAGNVQMFKTVGGSISSPSGYSGHYSGTVNSGDVLSVDLSGPSITVRLNGVTVLTASDSFNQSATRHGLHMDSTGPRLKHFLVSTDAPASGNGISLTGPQHYRTYQRKPSGTVAVTLAGTYSGTPASIEWQYGTTDWQTLVASPSGGTFSASVNLPATGGQYTVRVRFSDDAGTAARAFYVGVGDVFIVAGQSNADGRFDNNQRYSHATLRAGKFDLGHVWDECVDPTSNQSAIGSLWPLLATDFLADQGVPVAFITASRFSTGLTTLGGGGWLPPSVSPGPGPQFTNCVSAVAASGVNGVKAVLWYQGENDAVASSQTQANYESALKAMRADMETALGFGATLPLVTWQISSITGSTQTRSSMDAVRLAQSDAPSTDAHVYGPVCLYDQDTSIGTGAGAHLTTDGQAAIEAARAWRAIKAAFYGGTQGRGPRFSAATHPDSTHVDVAFSLSSGTSPVVVGAAPTTGWLVTSDSGTHAVTAASALNSTTVRLTLGTALGTNPVVSFGSYNDGVGATLADSGMAAAPAEPFVNQPVTAEGTTPITTTFSLAGAPATVLAGRFLNYNLGDPVIYNEYTPCAIDFGATGTDCSIGVYDNGTFTWTVDGGSVQTHTTDGSQAYKQITLFTGLSDGVHVVRLLGSAQNFYDTTNFLVVTGSSPAVVSPEYPLAAHGYSFAGINADNTHFTSDDSMGPYASIGGLSDACNGNGSLRSWYQGASGVIRLRGTLTGLKVFSQGNGQSPKFRVAVDGVDTGTLYTATFGSGVYDWTTLGTSYDGTAEHTYQISQTDGTCYLVGLETVGGAANTSAPLTSTGAVAYYGDSIMEGFGLSDIGNTCCRLISLGLGKGIRNCAHGGTSVSQHGGGNSGELSTATVTGLTPQVVRVVILYGTNDAYQIDQTNETIGQFEAAYEAMLTAIIGGLPAGTPIDCLSMLPTTEGSRAPHRAAILSNTATAVANVAAANPTAVLRYLPTDTTWFDPATDSVGDGLHPSAAGHAKIAAAYLATFAPALPPSRACLLGVGG